MPKRAAETPKQSKEERLILLGQKGAIYAGLKTKEKALAKEIKDKNTDIKSFTEANMDLLDVNGNHREVTAPIGDGVNELFVQVQTRKSTKPVDNIVALIKEKLGEEKAKNYINVVEVVPDNSLEAMFNNGDITKEELIDWTVTKETKSLIVKVNPKK